MFSQVIATLTVKLLAEKVLIGLVLEIIKHLKEKSEKDGNPKPEKALIHVALDILGYLKDRTSNTFDDNLYAAVSEALKD